jgi:hypothetical protein
MSTNRHPWQPQLAYDRVTFGPLAAALPFISMGMTVLGAGMSFMGSQQQAAAQQQAGNIAVQNAQMRQQQLEAQAKQQESEAAQNRAAANDEAAKGQRAMIEQKRKGRLLAGRAQAVMAASGAGVDDSMTAGLLAEGEYAGDVAMFEGDQRSRSFKNAANVNDYQAEGARYAGAGAVWQGQQTKAAYDFAASNTRNASYGSLIGGIAKAGMGIADMYGGDYVAVTDSTAKTKWDESLSRSGSAGYGGIY